MMPVLIHINGTPKAQPRGRHGRNGVVSTVGPAALWKIAVERAALAITADEWLILDAMRGRPVAVDHVFWFHTRHASRHGKLHTHKPDRDNLDKLILDALSPRRRGQKLSEFINRELGRNGVIPGDDCVIADGRITKAWSAAAGVTTTIRDPMMEEPLPLSDILGFPRAVDDDLGAFNPGGSNPT
jgi:Holliday junction resolvase RusA-like endonuclease